MTGSAHAKHQGARLVAPKKKRLLKLLAIVYGVVVLAVLVHAFLSMQGVGKLYALGPELVGRELTEPFEVRHLAGKTLDEALARALRQAVVLEVELADGSRALITEALGETLGTVTLPEGTTIGEGLWQTVLKPERQVRPDAKVPIRGTGDIIGFGLDLVLVVLNFFGLLCILYAFVWDPIIEMLDKRAETVRSEVEEARKQRETARSLRGKYDALMRGAKQEREELVAAGQRDGDAERRKIIEQARGEAEKVLAQARDEIGAEAARARRELRREVGALSAEIAAEILRRELRPDDHDALVREFLSKVGNGDGHAGAG